jgi:uncharacterized membrane protein YuzA (DUF378 family)
MTRLRLLTLLLVLAVLAGLEFVFPLLKHMSWIERIIYGLVGCACAYVSFIMWNDLARLKRARQALEWGVEVGSVSGLSMFALLLVWKALIPPHVGTPAAHLMWFLQMLSMGLLLWGYFRPRTQPPMV